MDKFAAVDASGLIRYTVSMMSEHAFTDGMQSGMDTLRLLPDDADSAAAVETLYWKDNAWAVKPPRPSPFHDFIAESGEWSYDIERAKSSICLNIDALADKARLAVVGDPVRVKEYEIADRDAKAFRDAGYSGNVPQAVKSWAEAKGWTNEQAALDILAASDRWYGALFSIRDARLKAKESVKTSTTAQQIDAIYQQYEAGLNALMALVS